MKLQKSQSNSFVESRGPPTAGSLGGFSARSRTNSPPRAGAGNAIKRGGSFAGGGTAPSSPGPGGNPYLSSTAMPSLNELTAEGENSDRPPSLRGIGSNNGGVKSGRADTFNPSVFQSANHVAGVDSDQGLFVDRNKRDLQIAEVRFFICVFS